MSADRPDDRSRSMRLVRCPACASGLIYPIDIAASEQRAVMSRRCPECEHRDLVTTCPFAASMWFDQKLRISEGLAALSEAIADGLPVEFVLADPPSAREP